MSESRPFRRPLLTLREVRVSPADAPPLGPMSWSLHRAERVHVDCAAPGQWEALEALLSGQREPDGGTLEELEPVVVQSDRHLREALDLNRSINDYLHSPDAPEHVWIEQRRRVLWVLVDLLGIAPSMIRQPLKKEDPAVLDKYWALRFMISRADLLLGREIFALPDPAVRATLRRRWGDLPGAVVVGAPLEALPGDVQTRVRFDAQGRFTVESGPEPLPGG
jgi:hypothetical protein